MWKNLWMVMDYPTYIKMTLLTAVGGGFIGWGLAKWEEAYREAKEAGAVA